MEVSGYGNLHRNLFNCFYCVNLRHAYFRCHVFWLQIMNWRIPRSLRHKLRVAWRMVVRKLHSTFLLFLLVLNQSEIKSIELTSWKWVSFLFGTHIFFNAWCCELILMRLESSSQRGHKIFTGWFTLDYLAFFLNLNVDSKKGFKFIVLIKVVILFFFFSIISHRVSHFLFRKLLLLCVLLTSRSGTSTRFYWLSLPFIETI